MVLHFAASAVATLKALQRQCPHCQHKQVDAPSKKNEVVRCERCDAEIPFKKDGRKTS
jgi:ribosomal protein S27E